MKIDQFTNEIKKAMSNKTLNDMIPVLEPALMMELGGVEPHICMDMVKVLQGVTDDYRTRLISYGILTHPFFFNTPFYCQNVDTLSELEDDFSVDKTLSNDDKDYLFHSIKRGKMIIQHTQIQIKLYDYMKDKITLKPEKINISDFTYIWADIQNSYKEHISEIEYKRDEEDEFSPEALNLIYYSTCCARILIGLFTNEVQDMFSTQKHFIKNKTEFFGFMIYSFSDSIDALMDGEETDATSIKVGDFTLTVNWDDDIELTPTLSVKIN